MNTQKLVSPQVEEPPKITLTPTEKFHTLFQARLVLSKMGTMEERRVCKNSLKRMTKELED